MTEILKDLKPQNVFKYFEIISSIPRGSGQEKAISDYMVQFAKELGLWVKQDEALNVYIKKPATLGYENAPTVILQGHMDMVCEKNKDTLHDFEKEGLNLYIDGDDIRAKGTTLGADNGVAIAYEMAVLADTSLKHPALEILMTTDEERGMTGVANMQPQYLEGKILINLDTDLEGEFLVSCAGGIKCYIDVPVQKESLGASLVAYSITVNGLVGGHSGADIHFERANAHILMGRLLDILRQEIDFNICALTGGSKDNVITRECEAIIAIEEAQVPFLERMLVAAHETFKNEYAVQDQDIRITSSLVKDLDKMYTHPCTEAIVDLLVLIPNGIISFDQRMSGLVETSLNLGIVQPQENSIRFGSAVRSSVPSKKLELVAKLETLSKRLGGTFIVKGDYPAWQYNQNSTIRDTAISIYKKMYDKEPTVTSIHAGLECGFIAEKLPGLDMISFGPNIKDIHSPQERASISSMARVYEYLVVLLENIKSN